MVGLRCCAAGRAAVRPYQSGRDAARPYHSIAGRAALRAAGRAAARPYQFADATQLVPTIPSWVGPRCARPDERQRVPTNLRTRRSASLPKQPDERQLVPTKADATQRVPTIPSWVRAALRAAGRAAARPYQFADATQRIPTNLRTRRSASLPTKNPALGGERG
jgi:hypothetical protein